MSDCPNALSAKPLPAPTDARASRLAKFKREQRIVDYLNRGVSVAEIAARVGVGEKRMRAIMREILARRMPAPPEEFVAIQVGRLNDALPVAYSAMSPTNLKAVDQVVKIVRELDRYGGAFAAEWARPEAPRLDAPAEGDVAFAKAWLVSAELAWAGGDDRLENPAQSPENIDSAPGNPLALLEPGEGRGRSAAARIAPPPGLDPGADLLPVNGPRDPHMSDGGRATPLLREAGEGVAEGDGWGVVRRRQQCWICTTVTANRGRSRPARRTPSGPIGPRQAGEGVRAERLEMCASLSVNGEKGRPENLAQGLENMDSAPGNADVAADRSPPREVELRLAPEPDDREVSAPADADPASSQGATGRCRGPAEPFAFGRCDRPENPAQPTDKLDSAPEIARVAVAAAPNDVALILTPTGWKPVRTLQNGMAAKRTGKIS